MPRKRHDDHRRIVAGASVLAALALCSVLATAIVCVALLREASLRYAEVGARSRTISQEVRDVMKAGSAVHVRFEQLLDPDSAIELETIDDAPIEDFVRRGEALAHSLRDDAADDALVGFVDALERSVASVRQARIWRERHDRFGGASSAQRELRAARAAVDHVRSSIIAVEGRRRLARVTYVHEVARRNGRFEESTDSLRRAIIAAFSATDVIREIDEIGILVERLGNEPRVDNLANLRDNQFRLAHRRLDECLARHESAEMRALRAEVPLLCDALYGRGWRDDEEHECVTLGEGGLFRARMNWLDIDGDRERLAQRGASCLAALDARLGDLTGAIDQLVRGVEDTVHRERHETTTHLTLEVAIASMLLGAVFFALLRRVRSAVAELHASREAALEASRAKSAFVANISHEIRTPMNGVLGIAELLEGTPLSAEQRRFVTTIRGSGSTLLSILNDVLDFSKLEAHQMRLESVPVAVESLVEDVAALFGPKAGANGVLFEVRVSPRVPRYVEGDPTRIRQVLFNLVGNAIKFTEHGTVCVDVDAEPIGESDRVRVRFKIADTGIGIDPATLARLFAPFAQSDESTTRRFGGTGLGLVICRRLVDLMGGRIEVDSRPGVGSVFVVEFPCRATRPESAAVAPAAAVASDATRGREVLVVEDNAVNQMVVARMLAKLGANVRVVDDGAKAVQAVAERPFDMILMDCHMPGMDGFEATRRIRADEGDQRRTPIVALTAGALDEDRRRCFDADMDDFLSKPVSIAALAAALARHVAPCEPGPATNGMLPASDSRASGSVATQGVDLPSL